MDSTMRTDPLLVSGILRHGMTVDAEQTVITATARGYRDITYAELGQRVSRLAHALRDLGVTGDQRVASFMWNSQEHLEAYFAVPSMGAVLHTLNIRLTPQQIAYIANEASDEVILVDLSLAPLLVPVLPQLTSVHTVIAVGGGDTDILSDAGKNVVRYEDILQGQPVNFKWPKLDETSAAAMCYTSGTTGSPKGVVYSHRSMYLHAMAVCAANAAGVMTGDRVLPIVPMFHANAWGLPYAAVMAGASLVMPARFTQAERLIAMIEDCRVTLSAAVPTILNDLLRYLDQQPDRDMSSLRNFTCGGSTVPPSLMKDFSDRYGVEIRQVWGMTETSPLASVAWPPANVSDDEHWILRNTSGRPVCGVEARIVDDNGIPQDWNGTSLGELEVRGPWITGSYYRGTDQSKFADGWLRTGDIGHINPRGYITIADRAKDVIKSGGEWISSVEVENQIMTHPHVLEACVVAVPDKRWQERPLAAVVVDPQVEVTVTALQRYLGERLVRWHVPERWTFVKEIPKTSVGKFDKKKVRYLIGEGVFEIIICGTPQRVVDKRFPI
jgi:fatty-acyl-CoA synthase